MRHDFVAAIVAQQPLTQTLQRRWHVSKGGSVSQGAGFSLYQRNVVLPAVTDVAPVCQALVAGNDGLIAGNLDPDGVQPGTHAWPASSYGTEYRLRAIATMQVLDTLAEPFDITIKHRGHGHQLSAFLLQHFSHAELLVFGVTYLTPQGASALAQPDVELGKAAKLARLDA